MFRSLFAMIAAIGLAAGLRRRASDGLLWLGFASTGVVCASFALAGSAPALWRGLAGRTVMWDCWCGREPMT